MRCPKCHVNIVGNPYQYHCKSFLRAPQDMAEWLSHIFDDDEDKAQEFLDSLIGFLREGGEDHQQIKQGDRKCTRVG